MHKWHHIAGLVLSSICGERMHVVSGGYDTRDNIMASDGQVQRSGWKPVLALHLEAARVWNGVVQRYIRLSSKRHGNRHGHFNKHYYHNYNSCWSHPSIQQHVSLIFSLSHSFLHFSLISFLNGWHLWSSKSTAICHWLQNIYMHCTPIYRNGGTKRVDSKTIHKTERTTSNLDFGELVMPLVLQLGIPLVNEVVGTLNKSYIVLE